MREVVEVDRRHCLAPPTMSKPDLNGLRADGLFRDFACRLPYFCATLFVSRSGVVSR